MIDIEFDYNQLITNIQAKIDDTFQDVINKFVQKSLLKPDSVIFLVNGKVINQNESVESYLNQNNKEDKKMSILVIKTEIDDPNKEQVIKKSKDIICPQCKEPCRISTDNYKIKL